MASILILSGLFIVVVASLDLSEGTALGMWTGAFGLATGISLAGAGAGILRTSLERDPTPGRR